MKLCIFCGVEVKPVITSPARLYGIPAEDVADNPYLAVLRPTGEYYCPKCLAGNCWVTANDQGEPIPDKEELASLRHWFSGAMGKQRPPFPALAELLVSV